MKLIAIDFKSQKLSFIVYGVVLGSFQDGKTYSYKNIVNNYSLQVTRHDTKKVLTRRSWDFHLLG